MGGSNDWGSRIAFEGNIMMIGAGLRWGELILGGNFAHLCMILMVCGVDYSTINIANAGRYVCKACGALDHRD